MGSVRLDRCTRRIETLRISLVKECSRPGGNSGAIQQLYRKKLFEINYLCSIFDSVPRHLFPIQSCSEKSN